MAYLETILYALFTFFSPCVLPMLTVYIAYFSAGEKDGKRSRWKTIFNVIGFCAAITIFYMSIFVTFAIARRSLDAYIIKYTDVIYSVVGVILILFGLKFMGYLTLPFLEKSITIKAKTENVNFINAFVLGIAFSLSMGMCGLGYISNMTAKILTRATFFQGIIYGLVFTLVIVFLFALCALLIDKLKGILKFIQRHYKIVNFIAGGILILMGVIMILGFMDDLNAFLQ